MSADMTMAAGRASPRANGGTIAPELRLAIADLNAEYAACLDERRFDAWPDFFTDDCIYKLQPRENYDRGLPLATMAYESKGMLKDRIYAATQTLFHIPYSTRHIVGWPRVTSGDGGELQSEANYTVIRVRENELPEVFSVGRYLDRIVAQDGRLRFRQRLAVFDSALIANSIIYPI